MSYWPKPALSWADPSSALMASNSNTRLAGFTSDFGGSSRNELAAMREKVHFRLLAVASDALCAASKCGKRKKAAIIAMEKTDLFDIFDIDVIAAARLSRIAPSTTPFHRERARWFRAPRNRALHPAA